MYKIISKNEFLRNTESFNELNQSDLKLKKYINYPNGFYVVAGANDGFSQEYTKIFEQFLGWNGILIEPSIIAYELCKINRPNDVVLNYALVESDNIKYVYGDFDGSSMSSINGERRGLKEDLIKASARTLTSIFKEHNVSNIDLLSIDVEGYEFNVLKGLDFTVYKPKFIIIEIYYKDKYKIDKILKKNNYECVENITKYYTWNHNWDGQCEDYLYKLKNI